jgi:uncharacterized protein (TIGR02246 family)
MRSRRLWLLVVPAIFIALSPCRAWAVQANGTEEDKAAIQKNAEAFVEAFDKGDGKALAAFWTPDGDYTTLTGRRMKGREEIEKAFDDLFKQNKNLKLGIDSDSLRFVTPDVAIEDGTTAVTSPGGGPPSRARYTIVHVKKDARWLMSSVRDAAYAPPTNQENLHTLEWAVGEWADEAEKGEIARVSFEWSENQAFIVSSYATFFKELNLGGGTQWIGWDPDAKRIRSWHFDTNGGFGEGSWTKDGDKWIIKSNSVMPDGKKVTATSIVKQIDADTISWQSTERTMDGKVLPETKEIRMKRVKP